MTQSQIDFDDEENDIIECCKYLHSLNKQEAVKKLIKIAGENESIKTVLEERKKLKKKK